MDCGDRGEGGPEAGGGARLQGDAAGHPAGADSGPTCDHAQLELQGRKVGCGLRRPRGFRRIICGGERRHRLDGSLQCARCRVP